MAKNGKTTNNKLMKKVIMLKLLSRLPYKMKDRTTKVGYIMRNKSEGLLTPLGINFVIIRRKNIPNNEIMALNDAYKELFKNENLTQNLKDLSKDLKKNKLVLEVISFLEKDKKRPICSPFSK